MEFKDRIKSIRKDFELSVTDLAAKYRKTESAIRAWENGRSFPDVTTLMQMAKDFDCTTDYLLGLSNYKNDQAKDYSNKLYDELIEWIEKLPSQIREKFIWTLTTCIKQIATFPYSNFMYTAIVKSVIYYCALLSKYDIKNCNKNDRKEFDGFTYTYYELMHWIEKLKNYFIAIAMENSKNVAQFSEVVQPNCDCDFTDL